MRQDEGREHDGGALIEARGLGRSYGGRQAVNNLSFSLHAGEVLGFLGPNGAGKSTTMRMLAGVLAPSAGEIRIAGVDLLDEPLRAKRAIGYLPENPPLYPELGVSDYLRYVAELHDDAGQDLDDAVEDAMERCGLTEVAGRLIGNLSKGFQQRVGIAQAIVHDPAVVILDEPTVGLDPIQIREIRELIRELGQQHTVILSTHILPEVQSVCSRVLIINAGRAVFSENLAELEARGSRGLMIDANRLPTTAEIEQALPQLRVERVAERRVRLQPRGDQALEAEAIAREFINAGWGLREVRNDDHSLEEIFAKVTASEPPSETNSEANGPGETAA